MISWTLSLDGVVTSGALIAVLAVLWRVLGLLWRLAERFTKVDVSLEQLTAQTGKIEGVLVTIAEQSKRIGFLEKLVDELRHGEGIVLPLHRSPYEASGR